MKKTELPKNYMDRPANKRNRPAPSVKSKTKHNTRGSTAKGRTRGKGY
mgnify:CR=1 FL=1